MSWLTKVSDLAGKAEDLLNQFDQNTAQALHKSSPKINRSSTKNIGSSMSTPTRMTSSFQPASYNEDPFFVDKSPEKPQTASDYGAVSVPLSSSFAIASRQINRSSGYASSSVSSGPATTKSQQMKEEEVDEKLLSYLNDDTLDEEDVTGSSSKGRSRRSSGGSHTSLPMHLLKVAAASHNSNNQQLEDNQGEKQKKSVHLMADEKEREVRELREREVDSRKSVQAKDSQLAVLRVRLLETDQLLQSRSRQLDSLKIDNTRLLQDSKDSSDVRNQALESVRQRLVECESELEKERLHAKHLEIEYREKMQKLEEESARLNQEVTSGHKMVTDEKLRSKDAVDQLRLAKYNLEANKHEFDEYKQKAQRILQTKEKLVETLKSGMAAPGEEKTGLAVELEETRAERDMLKDDLQQAQLMAYNLKAEIQDVETQLASEQRSSLEQQRSLHEQCQSFQASTSQCREQLEQLKLEYQYIQDELRRQQISMQAKLQEKDAEIVRLMNQTTARSLNASSSGELEQRIRQLTENLIQKQTVIEALQTDKNSLGLQLERLERMYREAESAAIRSSAVAVDIGTDSDVTSRVPAFLREDPYDTGVTRGMKQAYGTLDKLSVKAGIFLRRHPMARVVVFLYCLMLHIWVFFVLLTYSPEMHATGFNDQPPPGHLNG